MLLACGSVAVVQSSAQAATSVGITKTTNATSPQPSGQTFKYDLSYTCSSTTGSAHNVVITDVLPTDIEFVSLTPTTHVATYTTPAVGSTGTITLNFINPLPSGSAGIVPVFVRYKAGVTASGTVSSNTATIGGSDTTPTTVSSSVSTTSSASSTWAVSKTGATTATLGPTGVTYTVSLASSATTIGQLDLQNATLVDSLPVGVLPADVLDAAGATVTGTGATGNPVTLTWSLGTLSSVGTQPAASKTVTIRYPANEFTDGQVVQNAASASGTPVGGSLTNLGPATVNTTLSLPVVTRSLSKVASNTTPKIGQVFDWQLNPATTAAVSLDNYTITDTLPGNFTLQSVFTGTGYTNAPSGSFMTVLYETSANPGTFNTWTGSPFAENTSLPVSALSLSGGVYVTSVKLNYGTVSSTFAVSASAANRPYLRGVITNPARDGSTVPNGISGRTCVNNAALTASYNGFALPSVSATATATIATPAPAMTLTKASTSNTPFIGTAFTWQLNPVNTGNTPLSSFILTDTLPGNYTAQSVYTGNNYVNSPGGSFINIRYKTTASPSTYVSWTGGPFAANVTLPVSGLGLGGGVYLTAVEYNFGDVPLGFAASATTTDRPALIGVVANPTPNSSTVADGTTSQNSATLTASYNSVALTPLTATNTVTIPATTKIATFTKVASNTTPWVGQSFSWQLNPASTGTAPFDNFTVTDTLPANFTLVSVFTGTSYTNPPSGSFVNLRYKTTVNSSWTTWTGSPFAANTTQLVSALGLGVGEYVTAVEYNYGSVPVGFKASTTAASKPALNGVVTNPARDGSTPTGGTTVSNTNATLTASYGSVAITPVTASATATINSTGPAPTLTKTSSSATPPIGQSYSYYLRPVCPATAISNLVMVDTLPSNFTLVSIIPGITYTNSPGGNFINIRYKTTANSSWTAWPNSPFAASNTALPVSALSLGVGVYVTAVEYNFGNVPASFAANSTAANQPRITGIVSNPARDSSAVNSGDIIANSATLDGIYNGSPITTVTGSVNVTMNPTQATSSLSKTVSKAAPAIGESFDWRLSPANSGVVALDNFILADTLPSQFELKSITTGTGYANSPGGNFINIRYKTTANSNWTTWTGSPFAASSTALPVTALSLGSGVYVTAVEMNFGTVPAGFATSGTTGNKPKFTGVVNNPARDASAVTSGTAVTNSNITLNADYGGSAITQATATATATMANGTSITKTSSAASYDFGQPIVWQLRPQTTSLALTSFSMLDTLPSQFELTSIYAGQSWTGYVAPTVYYTTTANPSFVVWPGGTLASDATRLVSALGLANGVYVTAVRFDYGTVGTTFAASSTAANQPSLTGIVQKFARDGSTVSTVAPITSITNNATVTATLSGTPLQASSSSATVTMKTPTLTTSLTKAASPTTQQLGQPFDWQLNPVAATTPTTLSLNNFTITDTLPGAFELQSVYTGTGYANSPTGNFIAIRYKTTANSNYTTWTGSPFAANTTLNVSSLGLSAGVYVTDVEINYGTVAGNFAASVTESSKPKLTGIVNSPARNGSIIPDNGTVTNSSATLSATFGGVAITPQTASASVTLTTIKITPKSIKTVPSLSYVPGGTVPFQVETWNDATSQGAMVNPVGSDLLPDQVDYLPGTFAAVTSGTYNSAGVATPVLTIIPNFSGTRTLLRWQYTGSFAPNTRATVTFNVKVRSGTTSNDYTNLSGASATAAANQQMYYPTGVLDTLDLNGNGITTDSISQSTTASFNVGTSAAVDATKWVKGVLDKIYTKYPDYGATVAGGSINYNIDITNVGSVNLNNLLLIDILPSVGDVGVIDTSPRLSAWTPELTGAILVDNATVYYSTQANPNRSEVGGPTTGNLPNWSTTLPADPTTVRSFKIVWDASVVLTPGQALNFYIPMRAPLDLADGTIAWNSFAWSADPTGFNHLSAEPNKVGVGALNPGKAIGDFIWIDENSDGYQDPGEPGIPNVKVNLYDGTGSVVASTWTDTTGHYLFKQLTSNKRLQAEDYYVKVDATTLPTGVTQTPLSRLPNGDFGNQNQSTGYGYLVPATNSGADLTADFGYNYNPAADVNGNTGTGMIGDRVWLDLNGDGKQTPNEIGIAGVQLQLITAGTDGLFGTADDVNVTTTTTDATGYYRFDGLAAGAYQVKVIGSSSASHDILGGGYSQTGDPEHFGATSALSNDNLSTIPIVLGPGDVFLNADFGYQPTTAALGTIGDFVWLDANASGTATADVGEYGLPNVTVALIKDTNGNGTWDAGEPIIATTITAANGAYLFSGLALTDAADGYLTSAKYLVWVNDTNNALSQLRQTYDSNGITSQNLSAATLSSGTPNVLDQDFSYTPASQPDNTTAVIGDRIWFDANRNGIMDASELGIPGVLMELVDTLGRVLALTLADSNGYYFFGGLSPTTTYSTRVAARNFLAGKPLAGLVNTYDADGGLDGVSQVNLGASGSDGNADPDGNKNGINLGQDFGYGPPSGSANQGTIGNLIWLDDNANGVRDSVNGLDGQPSTDDDEPGIQGVTVDLYRDLNNNGQLDSGEPLIATTTTDANGAYLFSGLPLADAIFDPLIYATDPDASFIVRVSDRNSVLRGYWHSLGSAATDNQSQINPTPVTLTYTNPNVLSADYGYYVEPAAIGNYLWVDSNGNGLQDETGTGLANVEVILTITYPNGAITTLKTFTDSTGHYTYDNLLQDENYTQGGGGSMPSFVVSVAPNQDALAAYSQTHIGVGSNSRLDSGNPLGTTANPLKGLINVTGASSPSTMPTYDFGYFPTSELLSLGNRLWLDSNNNGIMDTGEPGLANVQVDLIDSTGVTVQATTYTDASGYYRFDGLLPGNYFVHIPAANWTGITGSPGGSLDGTTPLANYHSSLGCATAVQTSGTAAVGGIDHGVDNASPETNGISSLVIALAAGNQPTGDTDSGATGAGSHGPNGDARDNLAVDFGLFAYASMGDFVWNDTNANGIQDSGETGLAGVLVNLYRPGFGPDGIAGNADDSNPVASQTTPTGGAFSFTGLLPGTYQVGFGALSGYNRTLANQGADATKDSDANLATGLTGNYLLTSGMVNNSVDAGYYHQITLGGNVYDDANGLTDSTVNGGGTNVGGTLYANLIDDTNKVLQAVAVAADGSYVFGSVAPNTSYTIVLSTTQGSAGASAPTATLPTGYVNTGENIGANAGSDTTVDGILAVAVTTNNVTHANFGIEQLPDSGTATATSQTNPGGTTSVTAAANLFSASDADGTVTSIRITAFPSNATSVTINGTTYTSGSFPVGGVTVPTNTSGQPTQVISVDPIDGAVNVAIRYAAIDNAGREDPTPGTATLSFATVSLAGTVFDDANGLADSLVNGTVTNAGSTLYANLVDGNATVVAEVAVASNGNYGFSGLSGGNYTVVLSSEPGTPGHAAPAVALPSGWVNTGEHLGTDAGNDGTVDGILAVTVTTSSVTNANFGIDQKPTANPVTAASQPNPSGTNSVIVPTLNGSDPEDTTVQTFTIKTLPNNGTLYYFGSAVTLGQIITSYIPPLLTLDPNDGTITVSFTYSVTDAAGKESAPATVSMPFTAINLAGNVYDDANGLTDNTVNGTGTNAGDKLYANLVDNTNNVEQVVAVSLDGSYSFGTVAPNSSYTVVLSTTQGTVGSTAPAAGLPNGWVNTGEHLGSGSGSDGTVDGILAVTVTTSSISNANFGIEQLPESGTNTASSQVNPGGMTSVAVAANLFSGADVDGTVTGLRITAFPTNATSITINTTTYTAANFPLAGVIVTASSGQPTQVISVDPVDGAVSVVVSYVAIDNANKEALTPGSVTLPFTIPLSGIVFDDANGTKVQNDGELGTYAGGGLYVNLLNAAGTNVVATATVASNGTYSFTSVTPNTTFILQLSTVHGTVDGATPAQSLPSGWITTGENSNETPDSTPNGKLQVAVGTANVTGQNFGIEQLPDTSDLTATAQTNPGGTLKVAVPTFEGTDPEDHELGSGSTFQIISLPVFGTLYYDGGAVTSGQIITHYDPSKLTVDPLDGAVTVDFNYAAVDAAGKADPTPATVTMAFTTLTLSGTVWDDANGSANHTFSGIQTGSELGTNGDRLYANLINSSGKVIASQAVNSNGTYSFTSLNGNQSNLTINLTTTAGTPGSSAPTASLLTNWVNTSPLTQEAFDLAASDITAKDFGIEQPPTAQGVAVAGQSNPTGSTSVTVPSVNFVGTDPEGPVSSYVITAMPVNATSITISGTKYGTGYTSFPGVGVSISANSDGTLPTGRIAIDPNIDGTVTVPILFKVIDAAGRSSDEATVNVPFGVQTLSGTVWDDGNNSAAGTFSNIKDGSENGTNASGLYAILVDSNGDEVANTAVLSDGSYTFGSVAPNQTSVTVRLATSPGTPSTPAPAASLPSGWGNTSPLEQTAFNIVTTSISGKDFGIEQLPDSDDKTAAAQANPGGTSKVQVPELSGYDQEDGTLGTGMTLTISSLAIHGTLYYDGTTVALNQLITSYNPSLLMVDPDAGAVTVTFTYAVHDAAGKVDASPATVTMPFTYITLSGKVFNDANGLLGTPGNTVDGTGTNIGGALHVNLIDQNNLVLATTAVNSDGTYSFTNVAPNTLTEVMLTVNEGTPGSGEPGYVLPTGWVYTGESANATPDALPDGELKLSVGTSSVNSLNFGIDQLPDTQDKRPPAQVNPGGTVMVTVPTLTGSDPEDDLASGITSFKIINLPTAGTLYYDEQAASAGQVITNYDPTKLKVDPNNGSVSVSFTYTAVDAAGQVDPTPATVVMPFTNITLTGTVFDDANGSQVQNVGEDGTDADGLYVNLLDATATTVVATATVSHTDGTYSFANVAPNTAYTLQLTNNEGTAGEAAPDKLLPSGWITTGENSIGTSDGTPDGLLTVVVGTANISNQNFGIEQVPESGTATASSQMNPGGTTSEAVAATLFTGTDTDGTVTSLRITAFPTNATSITINATTTYTLATFPEHGVTVPTNTRGNPTQPISVDPVDGAVSVVISYAVIDNAGKQDPSPDSVELPFTAVSVSGTVFIDANGLTDTVVNGAGTNLSDTLYANLIDAGGTVLASVTVAGDGSYSFSNISSSNDTVQVTIHAGVTGSPMPITALPDGWMNTGEHLGSSAGSDGTPDGLLAVMVAAANVTQANFGVLLVADLGTITGTVRADVNGDSLYTGAPDPLLSDVELSLLDSSGNPVLDSNHQAITTTTASNGTYSFTGLVPGSYQVIQTQPAGYDFLSDSDGGLPYLIGDVQPITLTAGATSSGNDFLDTSCPDTWAQWKAQHPYQSATDNLAGGAYDNLAEFAFALPTYTGAGNAWWI
ncbi:MAG: SdrD B-like domain-containing protein, partial [Verrucomicrobiota bacterium]